MPKPCLISLFLSICALPALAAEASGCASNPAYHRLDFWLGSWEVYVAGTLDGRNEIVSILDGCAVQENWRDAAGFDGRSLFYVDAKTQRLRQIWVTSMADRLGGVKEKSEVALDDPKSVRFQGVLESARGERIFDRTTLTDLPDGTVHQLIEVSPDGSHWRTSYDAIYKRVRHLDLIVRRSPQVG